MVCFKSFLVVIVLSSLTTWAKPWDGAQHTTVQPSIDYHGTSPVPTEAPELVPQDLIKRQSGNQVCGFVNANINSAIYCPAGYNCAINTYDYAANCCINPYNCYYHTQCVPYTSMAACGASCQSNPFITRCVNAYSAYCYTRLYFLEDYDHPFSEVGCGTAPFIASVYETVTNQAAINTPLVTPKYVFVTTTAPAPSATAQQGGTTVNCGNGAAQGSGNGITCNIGNTGTNHSAAIQTLPSLGFGGVLVLLCALWAAVGLLRRVVL